MRTRVQLEKNIFAEYYENGDISEKNEYNNNGDLIKRIGYWPYSKNIWIIDEIENEELLIFKRTIYYEDGKTINVIEEWNNCKCINRTYIYDEDKKNDDDEIIYYCEEEEFDNFVKKFNNEIDCINKTYNNKK